MVKGITKKKAEVKSREMKVYFNEEIPDQPFPDLTNYEDIQYRPKKLADIKQSEGQKLTEIEEGAMNLTNHNSDELAEGATNKYLLDFSVTEQKLADAAVTFGKVNKWFAGKMGTAFPASPSDGELFLRTDQNKFYRYSTSSAAWIAVDYHDDSTRFANNVIKNALIESLDAGKITTGYLAAARLDTTIAYITQAAMISTAVIQTAHIGDLQVIGAKIANATIGDAKISDLTVEKLTGTYLTGKIVRTSAGTTRVEMNATDNALYLFQDVSGVAKKRIEIKTDGITFRDGAENLACVIKGNAAANALWEANDGVNWGRHSIAANSASFATNQGSIVTWNYTNIVHYVKTVCAANIEPNGAYDLGSSSYCWNNLYLNYLRFNSTYGQIYWGTDLVFDFYSAEVLINKNLKPAAGLSLGYSAERWANIYGTNIYCTNQTADKHITGDLHFKDLFRVDEDKNYLRFWNKKGQLIMKLSQDGELYVNKIIQENLG